METPGTGDASRTPRALIFTCSTTSLKSPFKFGSRALRATRLWPWASRTACDSQPIQSQMPSRDVAGIGSRSVVVILERSDLRFGVSRYHTTWRVERFGHIVV